MLVVSKNRSESTLIMTTMCPAKTTMLTDSCSGFWECAGNEAREQHQTGSPKLVGIFEQTGMEEYTFQSGQCA